LGIIETSLGNGLWVSQFILGNFLTNILIFHFYEESEHSIITSSYFKNRYPPVARLILLPVGIFLLIFLWILPIFMKFYLNPIIFILPKTYLYLIIYIIAMCLGILINILETVIFWILPFKHSRRYYNFIRDDFYKILKQREMNFKILDEIEYQC